MIAADWQGTVGKAWARESGRTDRSFAGLDPALLDAIRAAAPQAGRLVDIGCGAGATSLALAAARPAAEVVAVDLSADLLAVARRRAEATGAANLRFIAGDAAAVAASLAPVDLFVSRHGVMFFADPVAAFAALAAAAAPRGRLVFSCFAERMANRWASEVADALGGVVSSPVYEPGPFAFADPARVETVLTRAGWRPDPPRRIVFRYVAGAGEDPVGDAVAFFGSIGPSAARLREAADADRPALLARLAAICEQRREGDTVAFEAVAWLWSATAAGEAP